VSVRIYTLKELEQRRERLLATKRIIQQRYAERHPDRIKVHNSKRARRVNVNPNRATAAGPVSLQRIVP
jgi:hypothetical protein